MSNKFKPIYLTLLVMLTGVLILAPAVTVFGSTDVSPDLVGPDQTVDMIEFSITNGAGADQDFTQATVSFDGDDLADVTYAAIVYQGTTTRIGEELFDSSTTVIDGLNYTIGVGGTANFTLVIDTASSPTDGNSVDVTLESVSGTDDTIAVDAADTPFSTSGTNVTTENPTLDAVITGGSAGGNSTVADDITLTFTGNDLDSGTVDPSDFEVTDPSVDVSTVGVAGSTVTLNLASDLSTGDTPDVTIVDGAGIEDVAGLELSDPVTQEAADGLKPKVSSVSYDNTTTETLTLEFSEPLGVIGDDTSYTVVFNADGGATSGVTVDSVAFDSGSNVLLTIEDMAIFPTNGNADTQPPGTFDLTSVTTGDINDTAGNTVDDSNLTVSSGSVSDLADGVPTMESAETLNTTDPQIKVTFSESVTDASLDTSDFSFSGYSVDAYGFGATDNIVQLDLDSNITTGETPAVTLASSVEDYDGNSSATGAEVTPDDGIAPVIDSVDATGLSTIEVTYSEDVDSATVETGDYSVLAAGVEPANKSVSGAVVTLTLGSGDEFTGTDASGYSQVNQTGDVDDLAENTLSNPAAVGINDKISPYLDRVEWTDTNGNGTVDAMDKLVLTFSEPMTTGTIDSSTVNDNLQPGNFGSGANVDWTPPAGDDDVTITLASGESFAGGDEINPTTSVEDANTNGADAAVSASIPATAKPVSLDGTGYEDIEAALAAPAEAGDTILVHKSYDNDDSGEFPIAVGTEVTIQAADEASPVVNAPDSKKAFVINTAGVTIDGLTVKNTANVTTGQVLIDVTAGTEAKPFTLSNCLVDLTANSADDVGLTAGANSVAINNGTEFKVDVGGGQATLPDGGDIAVQAGDTDADVTIDGALFKGSSGIGYYDNSGAAVDISGATFDGTEFGLLITSAGSSVLVDSETVFMNGDWDDTNSEGAAVRVTPTLTGKLEITNSAIVDGAGYSINADDGTNVSINDSEISGNGAGMNNAVGTPGVDADDIDATSNFWGDVFGPSGAGPGEEGDAVSTDVDYDPWLDSEGVELTETTAKVYLEAPGWNMISVDAFPYNLTPSDLFIGETNLFYWDGSSYKQGDAVGDILPHRGYWYYASSGDVPSTAGLTTNINKDGTAIEPVGEWLPEMIKLEDSETWYMIGSAFNVDWGNAKVSDDSESEEANWMNIVEAQDEKLLSKWIYRWKPAEGEYKGAEAPAGAIGAGRGYWVKTGGNVPTEGITLKLPFGPAGTPLAAASMEEAGFGPVPEGQETPPAPPAVQAADAELEAMAAPNPVSTSDAVTFKVLGADVQSIKVQVFSPNGKEVFSESAQGSSLQWDAEVANGLYLYGVTAKVDGELKPLGIRKVLVLR